MGVYGGFRAVPEISEALHGSQWRFKGSQGEFQNVSGAFPVDLGITLIFQGHFKGVPGGSKNASGGLEEASPK